MEGSRNFNDILAEPLTMNSKEDWFEWVKNYLISQDTWEVTNSSTRPDENHVEDFGRWRRNNAAALHVIRISCGRHNLSHIRGVSEAKHAWDILYRAYSSKAPHSPPQVVTEAEELEMGILYRAIAQNNWSAARASIDRHPKVLNVDFATSLGETPLHVAAKFGHLGIVEELLRLVPEEYLEIRNVYYGYTPLATAATHSGVIPIAACMINKNNNAPAIPSRNVSLIPVTLAFICGNNKMGRYLYDVTPLQVFGPENGKVGPTFLNICLRTGEFDIALHLLQRCPELLFAADSHGIPTIERIAFYLSKSLNKSHLPLWKRWAYHYMQMPTTTTGHFCVDTRQEGESNETRQGIGLLHWLISSIYDLSGMKEIYKMKLQHAQAAEILNLVCENLMFLNEAKRRMLVVDFTQEGGELGEVQKFTNKN